MKKASTEKDKPKCQKCQSKELLEIYGHTCDSFGARCQTQTKEEYSGYVLHDVGIGGSDDIEFTYCLDCGQIQGTFPCKIDLKQWDFKY